MAVRGSKKTDTPSTDTAEASDISILKVPSFSVTRNLIQTLTNTVGDIYKYARDTSAHA